MRFFLQKVSLWIVSVLAVALLSSGCGALNDVDFARTVLTRLADGLYLARPMIDWSSLKMLKEDVGAAYRLISDENERAGFERYFIDNFKKGFRGAGANMRMFTNWRSVKTSDPRLAVVAVDMPASRTFLLLLINKEGPRPLLVEIKASALDAPGASSLFEKGYEPDPPKGE